MDQIENVSRETQDKLQNYVKLLYKWNSKINLTSKHMTEKQFYKEKISEAIFLSQILENKAVLDIGSGNGLPAVVIAICGHSPVTLIERNTKKCAFLQKAKLELNLSAKIIHADVKDVEIETAQNKIITSKAMASCLKFITICNHLISKSTKIYLLKNPTQLHELKELETLWSFKINLHKNTSNSSMIFEIYDLFRK